MVIHLGFSLAGERERDKTLPPIRRFLDLVVEWHWINR